jgi:polysaccharide biosynthesis protein VpsM
MKTRFPKVLCLLALALSGSAGAQMSSTEVLGENVDDIAEGGRLVFGAEADLMYTDNFYYTRSARKDSGFGGILKPGVGWLFGLPRFRFAAGASGEFGMFNQPGSEDDYRDLMGHLHADWQSAARHQFRFDTTLKSGHDPFGTERTEGKGNLDKEIDKWRLDRFEGGYRYGEAGATLGVDTKLFAEKKHYTSNRQATQYLDYHNGGAQVTLLYNYSPKTSLLFDTIGTRARQELIGTVDRGSNEMQYRVGARWLATAKTTGDVRVGYVQRSHVEQGVRDFSGVDWQVAIGWNPAVYRLFTVQTGRRSRESYIESVPFINTHYYTVDWTEEWSERFRTIGSAGFISSEFFSSEREDSVYTAGMRGEYRMLREVTLLGSVSYAKRESNIDTPTVDLDYDRLVSYVGVRYQR